MKRAILVLALGAVLVAVALRAGRAPLPAPPPRPAPAAAPPDAPVEGQVVVDVPPPPPPAPKETVRFVPRELPKAVERPAAPAATAVLWGRVTLMGAAPKPKRIRLERFPELAASRPEGLWSEELVVGHEAQVRWAIVHVSQGLGDRRFEPPSQPASLELVACRFTPRVVALQAEQPLSFASSDLFLHALRGLPVANQPFNFGTARGVETLRRFSVPEIFQTRCDIHSWEKAWIGVFDHPFFSVTDEEGMYRLPKLPPGRYRVTAWHEALKTETLEVDVFDQAEPRLDFLLQRR